MVPEWYLVVVLVVSAVTDASKVSVDQSLVVDVPQIHVELFPALDLVTDPAVWTYMAVLAVLTVMTVLTVVTYV